MAKKKSLPAIDGSEVYKIEGHGFGVCNGTLVVPCEGGYRQMLDSERSLYMHTHEHQTCKLGKLVIWKTKGRAGWTIKQLIFADGSQEWVPMTNMRGKQRRKKLVPIDEEFRERGALFDPTQFKLHNAR